MNSNNAGEFSQEPEGAAFLDAPQISVEIEKMLNSRMQSHANIQNLEKKLSEELKAISELKIQKASIQSDISILGYQIHNEVQQRTIVKKQIEELHKLSEVIADYSVQNDKTLKVCYQNENTANNIMNNQQVQINETIVKQTQACKEKETEIINLKESILKEEQLFREKISELDNIDLKHTNNINYLKSEIVKYKKSIADVSKDINNMISNNNELRTQGGNLENDMCLKKAKLDELQKKIEARKMGFHQEMEDISNKQEDYNYRIQQKDDVIRTLERAIKNQGDFNKSLQEKISVEAKLNSDMKEKKSQLEIALEQSIADDSKKQNDLNFKITSANEELKAVELAGNAVLLQIETLEQSIVDVTKTNQDIALEIKNHEVTITTLKRENDTLQYNETIAQNRNASLQFEVNSISTELEEYQAKITMREINLSNLESSLTAKINSITAEIEQEANKGEETTKAILEEMNDKNREFEMKTLQDQNNYTEQTNQLKDNLHKYQLEQAGLQSAQISLDNELENIKQACSNLKDEINTLNKNAELAIVPKPPPPIILPPPGPSKRRDFDEFSGSSAEGTSITPKQFRKYCRAKDARRLVL